MSKSGKIALGYSAGTLKSMRDVQKALMTSATRLTIGSVTAEKREGNVGDVFYVHPIDLWSLNALGLPNPGIADCLTWIPQCLRAAHVAQKSVWVSVAGFAPDEYADLARACLDLGVDGVELNLSCPNVYGREGRKPIPSYDPRLAEAVITRTKKALAPEQKVGVKISPVEDNVLLREVTSVLISSEIVCEVVGVNTIAGQSRMRHDGHKALNFDDGYKKGNDQGGLAGMAIRKERQRVQEIVLPLLEPKGIRFTAAGGIFTGQDLYEALEGGASGALSATGALHFGGKFFSDLWVQFDGIPGNKYEIPL